MYQVTLVPLLLPSLCPPAMAGAVAAANGRGGETPAVAAAEPSVFRTTEYSALLPTVAFAIWLGSIHLNIFLLAALLVLPSRLAACVSAVLLFLVLVPLDDKSAWGQKLSRYMCKYACGYFPMALHVEDIAAFDPNQAYAFGYEPHSVVPIGICALSNFTGFMPLPKIKIFYTPFLRHIWTWMGLIPATRKNFYKYLAAGYSCVVVPGGVQEMIHMKHDSEVVLLRNRKGFVRIAVEMGRPLVPVFCFGQGKIYKWTKPSRGIFMPIVMAFVRALKFFPIFFWGVYGTPLPYQHPIHVVVGRPIEVRKKPQPSLEEVDKIHDQFVVALRELFESHKARVGHPNLHLQVL